MKGLREGGNERSEGGGNERSEGRGDEMRSTDRQSVVGLEVREGEDNMSSESEASSTDSPPPSPVRYLKNVYPMAEETFLLDLLSGCDNNVQFLLARHHFKPNRPQPPSCVCVQPSPLPLLHRVCVSSPPHYPSSIVSVSSPPHYPSSIVCLCPALPITPDPSRLPSLGELTDENEELSENSFFREHLGPENKSVIHYFPPASSSAMRCNDYYHFFTSDKEATPLTSSILQNYQLLLRDALFGHARNRKAP
ncbi:unnamed protein product, partial [Cyprideis torosa]